MATDYGPWRAVAKLGGGGQADVFLVYRRRDQLATPDKAEVSDGRAVDDFVALLSRWRSCVGALKLRRGNSNKARVRFEREIDLLQKYKDAALMPVLDRDTNSDWFVMPYMLGGTVELLISETRLDPLEGLRSIRPLVAAVSKLHSLGIIHRDIKPANIFVDVRGRWVLGDLGIAFDDSNNSRVTSTAERVGSRDWLPLWHELGRASEVTAAIDCYCLGKVIWALVVQEVRLPKYYDYDPSFQVVHRLGGSDWSFWLDDLIRSTVVAKEADCLDCGVLLGKIDQAIGAMARNAYVLPSKRPLCSVCGKGHYEQHVDFDHGQRNLGIAIVGQPKFRVWICDYCGHTTLFFGAGGKDSMKW